ncbi:MAG TPA: hypothetical protein VFQ38_04410 [Longimicrobiales bacterium]|nr:hypothetical protein [Longimicrobiales bacterium]
MTTDDALRAEANRLYWESDASVGDIADRLGLSRRALYEALEPATTGEPCRECGTILVFHNRLARSGGEAQCPGCGLEQSIAALRQATADAGSALRDHIAELAAIPPTEAEPPLPPGSAAAAPGALAATAPPEAATAAAPPRDRLVALGGAMLAGAVAGAVTVLVLRRR